MKGLIDVSLHSLNKQFHLWFSFEFSVKQKMESNNSSEPDLQNLPPLPPVPIVVGSNTGGDIEGAAGGGGDEEKYSFVGIKRRRKLTEQAKERHRVCNRLGARRARAQARLDMEVMKAQNALLYLELSMTRAALYSVGQREFCARVAFDIEQAKGKFYS